MYLYIYHYFETLHYPRTQLHIYKFYIIQDDSKPIFSQSSIVFPACDPGTRILRPKGARGKHCHILSVLSKWIRNFPHISGVNTVMIKVWWNIVIHLWETVQIWAKRFLPVLSKKTLSCLQCIQYGVIKETLNCLMCYRTIKTKHYATVCKFFLINSVESIKSCWFLSKPRSNT
jgi:hypothetical protein